MCCQLNEYNFLQFFSEHKDLQMSRLAKIPVGFDSKVKVTYKDKLLTVKGQQGELSYRVPEDVDMAINKDNIQIVADLNTTKSKMMAGTARSLVSNMVQGVSAGFTKKLELVGVGYRAKLSGQKLTLSLGYSHPVEYNLPKIVSGQVEGNNKIILKSCDKQVVGQTAAEIRKFRPPEPYKGKGILFEGEIIKKKAGKTAKAAG